MIRSFVTGALFLIGVAGWSLLAAAEPTAADAAAALKRAARFFREKVSTRGGYLWRYSADLAKREGEQAVDDKVVWVQPPGTPTVGTAFLEAYQLTGDAELLAAARDAGMCLVEGQLESGGWDYRIDFDPERRKKFAYRIDGPKAKASNVTTLDDNTTQAALRFLMRLDAELKFRDQPIHGAVEYAMERLLAAQYPNGAWPQRFSQPPDAAAHPVAKASYPATWSRTWPNEKYTSYYTFNDNSLADMIDMMCLASRWYGQPKYLAAAERAGDFIILAQMPEPQPGWAQQYDAAMRPAWARKFEPPAITGSESRGVIDSLFRLYRETGKQKYLEPIPRALAYYRRCKLPGGGFARFYELQTNKPIYFTKQYELTYDDRELPTHYGFKVNDWVDGTAEKFAKLQKEPTPQPAPLTAPVAPERPAKPKLSSSLQKQAARLIADLDARGAWVEDGSLKDPSAGDTTKRIIDSRTFAKNLVSLAAFLAAARDNRP